MLKAPTRRLESDGARGDARIADGFRADGVARAGAA